MVSAILFRQLIRLRVGRGRLLSASRTRCGSHGRFGCNYSVNDRRRLGIDANANAFLPTRFAFYTCTCVDRLRTEVAVRPTRPVRTRTEIGRPHVPVARARNCGTPLRSSKRRRTFNSVRPPVLFFGPRLCAAIARVLRLCRTLPLPQKSALNNFSRGLPPFIPPLQFDHLNPSPLSLLTSGRTVSPPFFTELRSGHRSPSRFTDFFKLFPRAYRTPRVPVVK